MVSLSLSLLFLSAAAHCVVGETFYIVSSSADILCPGESILGDSCLTLQQYANNFSNSSQHSNITLELGSGIHSLNSTIFATNQDSFSMNGNINATILCHQPMADLDVTWLRFDELQNVQISGVTIVGCGDIRVDTAERFVLENSHFQKSGRLYIDTSNAMIVTSSFSGGVLDVRDSSVEVKQSTFSNKGVQDIMSYRSDVTVDQSTFKNNNSSSVLFIGTNRGTKTSALRILNSNFSGNTANFLGICLIVFDITPNSTVSHSQVVTISSSDFINNTGRAVYITYDSFELVGPTDLVSRVVTINQSSFTKNKMGAVAVYGDNVAVSVHQSSFTNNVMTSGDGGALYVSGINSSLSVDHSNFTDNSVGLFGDGGAVFIRVNGTNRFHKCAFINNTAGARGREGRFTSGGAIYSMFGYANNSISIDESTFVHNSAGSCGVLSASSTDTVHFTASTFDDNRAGRRGGVVCGRTMSIVRSNFSYNSAESGGVLSGWRSDVTILESNFNYNTAEDLGGALSDLSSPANYKITRSSFLNNRAGDGGGVLYMTGASRSGISQVNIQESIFAFNYAKNSGGAIAVSDGNTLEINGTTISNNTACLGGAISTCNNVSVSLYDTDLFQVSLSDTELSQLVLAPSIDQTCTFYESITVRDGNIITGNPLCVIAETTGSGVPDSEIITHFDRSRASPVVIIVSVYASIFIVGVIGLVFLLILFVVLKIMAKRGKHLKVCNMKLV